MDFGHHPPLAARPSSPPFAGFGGLLTLDDRLICIPADLEDADSKKDSRFEGFVRTFRHAFANLRLRSTQDWRRSTGNGTGRSSKAAWPAIAGSIPNANRSLSAIQRPWEGDRACGEAGPSDRRHRQQPACRGGGDPGFGSARVRSRVARPLRPARSSPSTTRSGCAGTSRAGAPPDTRHPPDRSPAGSTCDRVRTGRTPRKARESVKRSIRCPTRSCDVVRDIRGDVYFKRALNSRSCTGPMVAPPAADGFNQLIVHEIDKQITILKVS